MTFEKSFAIPSFLGSSEIFRPIVSDASDLSLSRHLPLFLSSPFYLPPIFILILFNSFRRQQF